MIRKSDPDPRVCLARNYLSLPTGAALLAVKTLIALIFCAGLVGPPTITAARAATTPLFRISGRVCNSAGVGLKGAVVSRTGTVVSTLYPSATTTDVNGNYALTGVPEGLSTTVTAVYSGYVFYPPIQNVTVGAANVGGIGFTGFKAYTVTGHVYYGGGSWPTTAVATVARTGSAISSSYPTKVTVDSSGNFTLTGVPPGVFTLTPAASIPVDFLHPSLSITVSNAPVTGVTFAALGRPSIMGLVLSAPGVGLGGTTLTLSSLTLASVKTAVTDSTGTYGFGSVPAGSYTVAPGLTGHGFVPASTVVKVTTSSIPGISFAGIAVFSITGRVVTNTEMAGVAGVTVVRSGAPLFAGHPTIISTDANGYFTFSYVPVGSYMLIPNMNGYGFSPGSRVVTVNGANASTEFLGLPGAYIAGRITDLATGAPLFSGVTVGIYNAANHKLVATTRPAADGYYGVPSLPFGTYTAAPLLTAFTFTPASLGPFVIDCNRAFYTDTDFAGSPTSDH